MWTFYLINTCMEIVPIFNRAFMLRNAMHDQQGAASIQRLFRDI